MFLTWSSSSSECFAHHLPQNFALVSAVPEVLIHEMPSWTKLHTALQTAVYQQTYFTSSVDLFGQKKQLTSLQCIITAIYTAKFISPLIGGYQWYIMARRWAKMKRGQCFVVVSTELIQNVILMGDIKLPFGCCCSLCVQTGCMI